MGATESNHISSIKFENQYKLIRRYTCPCYGQLTVIQNLTNHNQYLAMKEFVSEDTHILQRIQRRKLYKHPNLITLLNYWVEVQSSICSNLRKINLLYEYYQKNMEDELNQQIENGDSYSDNDIIQLLWQFIDSLNYLEEKGVKYLIGGLRSVKMVNRLHIKLLQTQQSLLTQDDKNSILFHFSASKRTLPLHPSYQLNQFGAISLNNQSLIVQNIFTIGLILLGLCLKKDPNQLQIISTKGTISFESIDKYKQSLEESYPETSYYLSQMLKRTFTKNIKYQNFMRQTILAPIPSKLNTNYQHRKSNKKLVLDMDNSSQLKLMPIQSIQKKQSTKRLSYKGRSIFK